ncbi:hypothetical protein H4V96_004089 [Janthinobacterium sp. CG_23.4]|nr:hypothetical protein [Janthinobacterium sp. CG_23.4]
MFAGGLNKIGRGGVVLSTLVPATSIITAPTMHSVYLQKFEYTADRHDLVYVTEVEFLPINQHQPSDIVEKFAF